MNQRFSYIKYDAESILIQRELKQKFEEIEKIVEERISHSRARYLIYTALEEAYMWTGKAIRDDQISRTGKFENEDERSDG